MSAKPQIFVFHLKEVIYTAIFIILGILFLLLLLIMFKPDSDRKETEGSVSGNTQQTGNVYVPGTYTTIVYLDGQSFEVQVTTMEDHISDITLHAQDSTLSSLYPLLEPSMASLSQQICETQSFDNLSISEDASYTSQLLLDAISASVAMAIPDDTQTSEMQTLQAPSSQIPAEKE